ncbi:hypothetical protein C8F01DRAFT_1091427 [Mycena amicta]|nr:hypothetical protein C8F01DRAFT_1091427 [Mycena amicta]
MARNAPMNIDPYSKALKQGSIPNRETEFAHESIWADITVCAPKHMGQDQSGGTNLYRTVRVIQMIMSSTHPSPEPMVSDSKNSMSNKDPPSITPEEYSRRLRKVEELRWELRMQEAATRAAAEGISVEMWMERDARWKAVILEYFADDDEVLEEMAAAREHIAECLHLGILAMTD